MSEETRMVNLDAETFDEFIRCLSVLKDSCNDVDIKNGVVRQRSNDRAVIFELDLNSIISDLSMPISNLRQKFDLFKMFSGHDVSIEVDEKSYKVFDTFSKVSFLNPKEEYMDNKYIPEEELSNIFELFEEDMLMQVEIASTISERLSIISKSFNVNSVKVSFDSEKGTISTTSQAKDQFAKLIEDIDLNKEIDKSISNLVITPFIIEHDGNIDFIIYNDKENQLINKSVTSIGDASIIVYGRSILVVEE